MDERNFSKKYVVRKLTTSDLDQIYELCRDNIFYYQHCPPAVTREKIAGDMSALPHDTPIENKYYVGYFSGQELLAVLDLIDGYPHPDTAFIGFFMTKKSLQNTGFGTRIIRVLLEYLKSCGFTAVQLAWVKGNPQAEHFWIKNGFRIIKETLSTESKRVILAECVF